MRSGPRASSWRAPASSIAKPPTQEPMTTPTRASDPRPRRRSRSTPPRAACTVMRPQRSILRASRLPTTASPSKPFTSAAMPQEMRDASNSVTGASPLCPASSALQVEAASRPTGVTIPMPVITTRGPMAVPDASVRPAPGRRTAARPTSPARRRRILALAAPHLAALALLLPLAVAVAACGAVETTTATTQRHRHGGRAGDLDCGGRDRDRRPTEPPRPRRPTRRRPRRPRAPTRRRRGTASEEARRRRDGEAASEPAETRPRVSRCRRPAPDGCTHVEPPTAGGERRTYDAPPSSGLASGAAGRRCDGDVVRRHPHLAGLARSAAWSRTPSPASCATASTTGSPSTAWCRTSCCRAATPRATARGGPGYEVTQAPPESYVYAKGDVAMAKLPSDPAARPARSSSSSSPRRAPRRWASPASRRCTPWSATSSTRSRWRR